KSLINILKSEGMSNHRIDLDLAVHVPVYNSGHVGTATRATKGRAFPDAAGDQLERSGRNLPARFSHADNDAFAPATMAGFQSLPHHGRIAGAIESVVSPAIRKRDQMRHNIFADFGRVDEMRHAEACPPFRF